MKHVYNRRSFIKNAGVAAALPILPLHTFLPISRNKNTRNGHNILTCNIRVALDKDEEEGHGWNSRKDLCIEVIKSKDPDIFCLQEVLKIQNEDLKKAFPGYFSFGFEGPEMDAFTEGYHGIAKNPIFFSKKKYELVSAGTYWLSETPQMGGSKSWGTARARHANWVRLKNQQEELRVVNLHLDHVSQEAREKQINLVLEEAAQYPDNFKQILTGDFNASADNKVIEMVKEHGWKDSYTVLHGEMEPGYTVHSFLGENYPDKAKRKKIDFIFYRGGEIEPVTASIIKDHKETLYPSDHFFVSTSLKW